MSETIFSKILRGEIPCHKVYEDDHVLAFLDIGPLSEGHTLVIPKEPAATLDAPGASSYQQGSLTAGIPEEVDRCALAEVAGQEALDLALDVRPAGRALVPVLRDLGIDAQPGQTTRLAITGTLARPTFR